MEIAGYDILLGLDWCEAVSARIDCAARTIDYPSGHQFFFANADPSTGYTEQIDHDEPMRDLLTRGIVTPNTMPPLPPTLVTLLSSLTQQLQGRPPEDRPHHLHSWLEERQRVMAPTHWLSTAVQTCMDDFINASDSTLLDGMPDLDDMPDLISLNTGQHTAHIQLPRSS